MLSFLLRRLLFAIPTLALISALVFFMIDLAPGSPMSEIPLTVPPEVRAQILAAMGADQPAPLRYFLWVRQIVWSEPLHGLDAALGTSLAGDAPRMISWQSKVPVFGLIAERLPQTLTVIGGGYLLGVLLALPLGMRAAARRGGIFDHVTTFLSALVIAMPGFLIAQVLILVFAVKLGWFPSVYDTNLQVRDGAGLYRMVMQMALPVIVLALFNCAEIGRYTRAAVLEQLGQDYTRTARAKGLTDGRVLRVHVLRNAMAPVVTIVALGLPAIFGGAMVIEQIFRINGIGAALIGAIQVGDLPVIQTITFLYAVLIVLSNLLADLLYAVLDPRVVHG
ncbi:ABC transporter permease [Gemmobacter serpentinus]|uniref:ABC transporter permease n=1 Tax=Gemmobacter serpentinus TaxID=2652247 RepID=UPI00124D9820|nr:ABC transporter permease [Gemmobacter serpentinus]